MGYPGAWGKLIHEKTEVKVSWRCTFTTTTKSIYLYQYIPYVLVRFETHNRKYQTWEPFLVIIRNLILLKYPNVAK
jgi:hypothetical protein